MFNKLTKFQYRNNAMGQFVANEKAPKKIAGARLRNPKTKRFVSLVKAWEDLTIPFEIVIISLLPNGVTVPVSPRFRDLRTGLLISLSEALKLPASCLALEAIPHAGHGLGHSPKRRTVLRQVKSETEVVEFPAPAVTSTPVIEMPVGDIRVIPGFLAPREGLSLLLNQDQNDPPNWLSVFLKANIGYIFKTSLIISNFAPARTAFNLKNRSSKQNRSLRRALKSIRKNPELILRGFFVVLDSVKMIAGPGDFTSVDVELIRIKLKAKFSESFVEQILDLLELALLIASIVSIVSACAAGIPPPHFIFLPDRSVWEEMNRSFHKVKHWFAEGWSGLTERWHRFVDSVGSCRPLSLNTR